MRVLLIGSGGREHALAQILARSPLLSALFIAPGNPGTALFGTNIAIDAHDVSALVAFAQRQRIDLVIPGPEAPLVAGIADACAAVGLLCAGPTQAAARLEGSKSFAKDICKIAGIPTASGQHFTDVDSALHFIRHKEAPTPQTPLVIKADGLAAGKGVVITPTRAEAESVIRDMMTAGTLGQAGRSLVIEDYLEGEEVSLFAFCAGETALLIGAAQDHKRLNDGDTGPNTGGMGAVSPPKGFDRAAQEAALDITVRPMLREMVRRGTPFCGVIFAGLMLTQNGPFLIEYNVRFGDPEAEALLPRLTSDLLPALYALAQNKLDTIPLTFSHQASVCVVMAAQGYPASPQKGSLIHGLETAASLPDVYIFQAGTARNTAGELVTAGGRVLAVCALGDNVSEAQKRAYTAVKKIHWHGAHWRTDIGARTL
ncbi:MAG: phosphoribosylamine--glycine ligase [Acetobacter sp.]|nr:phosphoribosylamine--glycine ligase [Acetobacter sp.]